MDNPVLIEVTRGGIVETRHRGRLVVVDADGAVVLALGDVDRPVFARSAIKGLQAIPLIESGAADRFGLEDSEIALACASHSGEPEHAAKAASMLKKAGRDGGCLECGVHWPMGDKAARALAAEGGSPGPLHNNCSGKHSGFVCVACALDADPVGYVTPEHRVQMEVRAVLEAMTGAVHGPDNRGVDGCSIPAYAVPLRALALGFARFGSGQGVPPVRAAAAQRIRHAVAANPFMVAGTRRFDTVAMEILRQRAFIKVGAEGVYCGTLPEQGLGIALKIDDGAGRAAEVAMASLLLRFLTLDDSASTVLAPLAQPTLRNWNGIAVGELRPASALAPA